MAVWRTLPVAAMTALVAIAAAMPEAAAAAAAATRTTAAATATMALATSRTTSTTTAAGTGTTATAAATLTPTGRQCTQAGDFPHHDGCSATVRGVGVPLPQLAGRWYMWDLSNDAKDYYKSLLRIDSSAEVTCPTMDNTVARGVVATTLCMSSRARTGGRIRTSCARFRVRRAAGRGGRYDPAAPLVWSRLAPRFGRRPDGPVKILAAVRWPGGGLKSFATYACPEGHAPRRLPCVEKGVAEVVGVWTRLLGSPGLYATAVMSKRRIGIEALNEFQQLSCPTFRT